QGRTTTSECKLEKENDKIVCKTHNKPLCGKLYTTDHGNTFNSSLTTQTYNANSVRREPAILTSTTSGDAVSGDDTKGINLIAAKVTDIKELVENTENSIDLTTTEGQTEVLNAWKEMLQEEFDEMIKSVEENKGFYVGRYENSLTDDKTKIQSKKNKPSATANTTETQTWYGLYQANKEYSEKNGLIDVVGSSMIWGNQYDQIMIWMQKNGYTVTSVNSSDLKGATKNTTQTTGKEGDKDILNNVYDLLGCNLEWTLEAYTIHSRAIRRRLLPQRQISFESFQQRSILYS
ncbi:MAG: hypothetical protein HFJ17_05735, partial [Clostridia bacterium]|nr:hypothetical protein [Clostridia bacterium]